MTNFYKYGNLFECFVCDYINNNNSIEVEHFLKERNCPLTEEEINQISNDAKILISNSFSNAKDCKRIGGATKKENGDLIIDNVVYELKYVSQGNGTYLNTSIDYFRKIGGPDFKLYIDKYICPLLVPYFGETVYKNLSPVSLKESKYIRYNEKELYEKIKREDKTARIEYVKDLYSFFKEKPEKLYHFYYDIFNKSISDKVSPNSIIIFNYLNKEIKMLNPNLEDIIKVFKASSLGFTINDFRVQIGWQNGNELNNPTIRAFIK